MLVGITGNLGSGKSTLRRAFGRLGYNTYDADEFVSELYMRPDVVDKVAAEFGQEVVHSGTIERKRLAQLVFNSQIKLRKLNSIIHPLVAQKIAAIKHQNDIVFIEVPLLFESAMEKMFDKIVLAHAPRDVCRKRALQRGFAEEEFEKRVAAQFTADRAARRAHFVIDTSAALSEVSEQARHVAESLAGGPAWKGL